MAQAHFRVAALTKRMSRTPRARRVVSSVCLLCTFVVALLLFRWDVSHTFSASKSDSGSSNLEPSTILLLGEETVVLTAVNYGFRDHLANLRCSLAALGMANQLRVVALDDQVADWARKAGFVVSSETAHNRAPDVVEGELKFDSAGFNLLSKKKISAVQNVLQSGANVLFTDADMFWCADALSEILTRITHSGEDLVMQTAWPRALLNSGFYFVRAGKKSIDLFEELLNHPGDAENDQVIFNRVLCNPKMGGKVLAGDDDYLAASRRERRPKGCRRGDVTVGVLDKARYPTGGELFNGKKLFHYTRDVLQGWCSRKQVSVLHNNCILGDKKIARFIVKGFWYVADDGNTCSRIPAPISKAALKRCGMPKCGREEFEAFFGSRKGTNGKQSTTESSPSEEAAAIVPFLDRGNVISVGDIEEDPGSVQETNFNYSVLQSRGSFKGYTASVKAAASDKHQELVVAPGDVQLKRTSAERKWVDDSDAALLSETAVGSGMKTPETLPQSNVQRNVLDASVSRGRDGSIILLYNREVFSPAQFSGTGYANAQHNADGVSTESKRLSSTEKSPEAAVSLPSVVGKSLSR